MTTNSVRSMRQRWSVRLFVADIDEPRSRRAGDLIILLLSLAGLALLAVAAVPGPGFEFTISRIINLLPGGLRGLWETLLTQVELLAIALAIAALLRRRWSLLFDLAVGVVLAVGAAFLIARGVSGQWVLAWSGSGEDWIPLLRYSIPATVIAVSSPHLVRPFRVLGWWAILLGWLGALLSRLATPTLGTASLLVALAAAASTALLLGSPRGRPDVRTVRTALGDLGVMVGDLGVAERQTEGVFLFDAVTPTGERLEVKVYGRDAYDTQLVSTLWRMIWFRRAGAPSWAGRLRQVEHEAFLTMLAAEAGIAVPRVVTAGLVGNGDALLVLEETGDTVVSSGWDRDRVAQMFEMIQRLNGARISHGQVDDDHLLMIDGRVGLSDFRGASTADPWQLRVDQAQALVTAALAIGVEPALDVANDYLGTEELVALLPSLQADVLTPRQRSRLRAEALDVDQLRTLIADVAGVQHPRLTRLRRVTPGSVVKVVLPVLAFFALASVIAGLDLDLLGATLAEATWWVVGAAIVVSQLPRFTQALSAMGASPIPIPLKRLYLLQLAQSFVALAIPGAAARIAVNTRFFQRQGLGAGSALAVGALDSFATFLTQMVLLLLILTTTSLTLDLGLDAAAPTGVAQLVLVILAVAVMAALVILIVPRWRRPTLGRLKTLWVDALSAVSGLNSPRRLGLLFGGGLGTELFLAAALGVFAAALGFPIGFAELIVISVSVQLLAGVLPVPGGIGVVEGGILFGLARAGVPEEAAFAIAILFRIGTFYLPPAWGYFGFRYLERGKHL